MFVALPAWLRCHPTTRPLWYEGRLMLVSVRGQCETDVNLTRGPGVSGMTSRRDIAVGQFDLACRSSPGLRTGAARDRAALRTR